MFPLYSSSNRTISQMNISKLKINISILIVYYDNQSLMQHCLDSIVRYAPEFTEIIIINNSPSACSFKYSHRLNYKLVDYRTNYGFGKANNIGLSYAQGEYLLLLNPDTEITDEFIGKSIELIEKYPAIAAVGPKLIDDRNIVQNSAFKFPTLKNYLLHDILFIKDNDINTKNNKYQDLSDGTLKCDWLCGAAIMFRREIFEKVKGFDTRYFLYYEDVDLFNKIHDAGYDVAYCPSYIVKHYDKDESGIYSNKFNNAQRIVAHDFSMMQYWHKHKPEMMPIVRFLVFVRSLSRLVIWGFSPSLKAHAGTNCVNERIRGYLNSILMSVIK